MSAFNNSSTSTDQNDPNKDKSKTPKSKDMHLPISRVRTIMKSTPDIENIGLPSLHVVTKATELFIQKLAQDALKGQRHFRHLEYNDLARAVEENENMYFLRDELQHASCGTRVVSHHLNQRRWPQTKIIGGSTTPYGAYPWQVELQAYKDGWEHHCGGALISETIALTAAHCLRDFKKSQLRIIVGKHNLAKNDKHEKTYRVQKTLVHPEFSKDGPHSHDIAILKINSLNSKGVKFDSHVQPICLPDYYTKPNDVDWCTVTGWGAQKQDDMTSLSKVLQAASVPLLDLETCRHEDVYGGRHQSILDSMLCAGSLEGGVDACGGDSGGPLACQVNGKFILTGVVSWGDGCGKKNRPGVYTRVSYYTDWLKKVMTELENNSN